MDWRTVTEDALSPVERFWGEGVQLCTLPTLLWEPPSKLWNQQVLNCAERLMVCFLFPVGLWRRIVLKFSYK